MSAPSRRLTLAILAGLTLIWGTTWAAIRIGLASIPPFTGVSLRFALAAAILLPVSFHLGVRLGATARERRLWVVIAVLTFCTSYGVVYWSEQWVPSGLASVLFATFPLFTGILAHFLLPEERLRTASVLGILLGFAGVAVIFSEDFALLGGEKVATGAMIFMLSPLVSSIASVSVKRWGHGIHPVSLASVPMAMTAVIMGGVALLFERDREVRFDVPAAATLVYLAIFGSALSFTLYYWLLSHLPATSMALISYTVPIVAVLVGTVFLDEPLTVRALAGSMLVVLGVALALQTQPRGPQKRSTRS